MRHIRSSRRSGLAGLFLAFVFPVHAQDDAAALLSGVTPLFTDHTLLEVKIEAPLKTLMKERPNEEYLDGVFRLIEADG